MKLRNTTSENNYLGNVDDNGTTFTNASAEQTTIFHLPRALVGFILHFRAIGEAWRLVADGGVADVIRQIATTGPTNGYIESANIGAVLTLECLDEGYWTVTSQLGTWNLSV